MSTELVKKTTCDRCKNRPAPERPEGAPPAFHVVALEETVTLEDLCEKCHGVCRDYLRKIAKLPGLRKRAKKEEPAPS